MNEDRYFGSDLNKYIHESLSKEMTVINLDLIQYKRSKNVIRIIESKHTKEKKIDNSQLEVLIILAKMFKLLNEHSRTLKREVFIVTGDQPYDEIIIEDLINNTKKTLKGQEIKDFLEFNNYV